MWRMTVRRTSNGYDMCCIACVFFTQNIANLQEPKKGAWKAEQQSRGPHSVPLAAFHEKRCPVKIPSLANGYRAMAAGFTSPWSSAEVRSTSPSTRRRPILSSDNARTLHTDDYGLSVYAKVPLPAGASAVTCPFALAITPAVAHQNLQQILSTEDNGLWTDHELMALYLALSYKQSPGITRGHDPYISALPKPKDMRTPVYFTYDERRLLAGTNLEGAVNDRENGWRNEFNGLLNRLAGRPLHSVPTL